MKILLLSIFFYFSNYSFAETGVCGDFPYFSKISFEKEESCSLVNKYNESLIKLSQILDNLPIINLEISDEGRGAAFSDSGTIYISKKILSNTKDSNKAIYRSESANVTTFVHEYGHAILSSILSQNVVEYRLFKDANIAIESKNNEMFEVIEKIKSLNHVTVDNGFSENEVNEAKEQQRTLMPKYSKLSFELDALTHNVRTDKVLVRVDKIVTALHELYADTIAVLVNDDLDTMFEAIIFDGMPKELYEEYKLRSFSNYVELENWNNDQKHALFAPVRSYLGQMHLKTEMQRIDKKEFLSKFNNIVVSYFEKALKLEELHPYEMNVLLIEEIETFIMKKD